MEIYTTGDGGGDGDADWNRVSSGRGSSTISMLSLPYCSSDPNMRLATESCDSSLMQTSSSEDGITGSTSIRSLNGDSSTAADGLYLVGVKEEEEEEEEGEEEAEEEEEEGEKVAVL